MYKYLFHIPWCAPCRRGCGWHMIGCSRSLSRSPYSDAGQNVNIGIEREVAVTEHVFVINIRTVCVFAEKVLSEST